MAEAAGIVKHILVELVVEAIDETVVCIFVLTSVGTSFQTVEGYLADTCFIHYLSQAVSVFILQDQIREEGFVRVVPEFVQRCFL